MVETATDTERSLLTTTRDGDVVVLAETRLGDGVTPVGIVAILSPLGKAARVVQIVDFGNSGSVRSGVVLTGVEVGLLQHHGVVVTTQQVIALGLMGGCELQGVGHVGLATDTTLGGQLDDTVTTLRTIDGRCGSVLQHVDGGDVLRVDVQQFSELLVVGTCHIEVVEVHLTDVTVDHDQRVGVGQGRE